MPSGFGLSLDFPAVVIVAWLIDCSCQAESVYTGAQRLMFSLVAGNHGNDSTVRIRLLTPLSSRLSTLLWTGAEGGRLVVGEGCAEELRELRLALARGDRWSLAFADSFGKPPAGVLNGATTWLGSYDQCLSAGSSSTSAGSISGTYCLLKLSQEGQPTPKANVSNVQTLLTLGSCWPSACSISEAVNVTRTALRQIMPGVRADPGDVTCRARLANVELTPAAIGMLALLGTIAVCMVAGTVIDLVERSRSDDGDSVNYSRPSMASAAAAADAVVAAADAAFDSSGNGGDSEALLAAAISRDNRRRRFRSLGILRSVLLCFSVTSNARKILSQKSQEGCLRCVNGVRFLSMSWVILGHTYLLGLIGASNLVPLANKWINDWTFQAVLNATLAVDSFFVLSGLLATYLFMRELELRNGQLRRINWIRFYLHRYWRLTAPYMIILGAYTALAHHLFDGPRFPREGFDKNCRTNWWRNLLYINNLFSMEDMCMPWSWYLANDMQFYVISPLVLVPIAIHPAFGAAIAGAGILASTAAVGIHSTLAGQPAGYLTDTAVSGEYTKPWFRIGPYLVGSLAGLLAHRTLTREGGSRRLRHCWALRLLGWCLALGLCCASLYSLFDVGRGRTVISQPLASVYNATYRLAWSLGVAWVVLACATGNGGCVANFLSSGAFAPLSRLSYCAYLLHPAVMAVVETARRDLVQWDDWTPVGNYLAYLLASYALAFGASMALESPLIGLERLAIQGNR